MLMRRYDIVAAPMAPVAEALGRRFDRAVHVCGNAPGVDLSAVVAVPVAQLEGRRFVLLVGTVEPRKNYDALLAMLALNDVDAPVFVVAGRAGWGDIVQRMSRASDDPRLVWLDNASDGVLAWLYRHCAAFVSLSLAEGFNMPLAEAAGAGCPIVCTDNAVHRDVAPASATFVLGSDPHETLAAIVRASALPRGDGGEFRARYSWSRVADAVLRLVH
jgi:glycosyltransferase involved in cell wall biosynthesis